MLPDRRTILLWLLLLGILCCGQATALSQASKTNEGQDDQVMLSAVSAVNSTRHAVDILKSKKLKCEDVHLLPLSEQCAHSRQYCDYADTGLIAYLDLYFCDLSEAKSLYWVISVLWLLVLFASIGVSASEFLTINLGSICTMMGISHSLAGVTFLALGNGSPDLFSTFTAMSSHSASLAVGELIGAAGFITTVVAAATGFVKPFKVKRYGLMRDVGFFAIAVVFTLIFLVDGKLSLWNCIVMVFFYVIYVIVVLAWHYILGRIKKQQAKNTQARSHFTSTPVRDRSRQASIAMGNIEGDDAEAQTLVDHNDPGFEEEEEDAGAGELMLREIDNTMRVTHRHRRTVSRMTTVDGRLVRPSLLGALEFGSVLSKLERSRSQMSNQLAGEAMVRRHSEDPCQWSTTQERNSDHGSNVSPENGLLQPGGRGSGSELASTTSSQNNEINRKRSASLNTPAILNQLVIPQQISLRPFNEAEVTRSQLSRPQGVSEPTSSIPRPPRYTPDIPQITVGDELVPLLEHVDDSETTLFPRYTDDPNSVPTSASMTASPTDLIPLWQDEQRKPGRLANFWTVTRCILFPQLESWRSKVIWDKILSLLSTPAILALTLTVPVGEALVERRTRPGTGKDGARREDAAGSVAGALKVGDGIATSGQSTPLATPLSEGVELGDCDAENHEMATWNPYLMAVQIFAAPQFLLFVVWRVWLGSEAVNKTLAICTLSIFGASCVVLALFLRAYKVSHVPTWQQYLAYPGFCVAIAWISLIAGEVVGVLKAFQLITGFSEAILGLTVFAAGNSVSDMFANFNTARAGKPVMAFHACFGGPMLNILLGIGLGGAYHTVLKSRKHANDGSSALRTEFHIEIGRTLIVSGAGLLVTLVGLMLALWWNKWTMDRKIGIGLTAAWVFITTANVVLEVLQIKHVIKPW